MKTFTVRYFLTEDEAEKVGKIAKKLQEAGHNLTSEEVFELAMVSGCSEAVDRNLRLVESMVMALGNKVMGDKQERCTTSKS